MSTPDRTDIAPKDGRSRGPLLDALRGDFVPRMKLAHRVGSVPPSLGLAVGRRLTAADQEEFLRRVRGPGENAASEQVRELVTNGVTVETVMLELLAPAARRLGEEWKADTCDFVDVTVALGRMQRVLRSLGIVATEDHSDEPVGRVLLATLRGEQHILGLLMAAELFVRAGWAVTLGAPVETLDLEVVVAKDHVDVVGLSLSSRSRIPEARALIDRLRRRSRNSALPVMVGGPLFLGDPDVLAQLGADAHAPDAAAGPALAAKLARIGVA